MEKGAKLEGRLDIGKPNHKYGWIAKFKDGSIVRQFDKGGVEHNMGHIDNYNGQLESFTFQRRKLALLGGHQIIVHLDTGIITIDGMELLPYDGKDPIVNAKFKIEFWMRTYSTMKMSGMNQDGGAVNRTKYFVGWSTEYNGRKIKRIVYMGFNGELGMG